MRKQKSASWARVLTPLGYGSLQPCNTILFGLLYSPNDTACKVLRSQIGNHSRFVFVHMKEGNRPDGSKVPAARKMRVDDNTAWHSACREAGIENFRFHGLKHTWASWLVQSGVPLSALQEMGGWESIEMVRRYVHLSPVQFI